MREWLNEKDTKYDSMQEALNLLTEANEKLKNLTSEAGEKAIEAAREVTARAGEISRQTAKQINDSAHENPWRFIGVATALSLLSGFYLGKYARRAEA